MKYLLIAIGGALGSIARAWVTSTSAAHLGASFPYGTLFVNLTACFVIGLSITYMGRRAGLDTAWRFLVGVGFIGAFSTFSTFEWETYTMIHTAALGLAALYAGGSFLLGLIAVWSGSRLGEVL
jgi:fluoride exporter